MNKKSIAPNPQQPVSRVAIGQLSSSCTRLSPDAVVNTTLQASQFGLRSEALASYDGDEE